MSTLMRTRRTYGRTRQDLVRPGRHTLAGLHPMEVEPRCPTCDINGATRLSGSRMAPSSNSWSSSLCGEWGFMPPLGHQRRARVDFSRMSFEMQFAGAVLQETRPQFVHLWTAELPRGSPAHTWTTLTTQVQKHLAALVARLPSQGRACEEMPRWSRELRAS